MKYLACALLGALYASTWWGYAMFHMDGLRIAGEAGGIVGILVIVICGISQIIED